MQEERIRMEILLRQGFSFAQVAKELGKDRSTVYREFDRGTVVVKIPNKSYKKYESGYFEANEYSAQAANIKARRSREHCCKINKYPGLAERISELICKYKYSPAVVAEITDNIVCHKTIYNSIQSGALQAANIDLWAKVSRKISKPRPTAHKRLVGVSIEQRPDEVRQRETFGHLEGDIVVGKQGKDEVLLTLTERKTRKGFVVRMPNREASITLSILNNFVQKHTWVKSITFDNGVEFAHAHKLPTPVYYAHPYSAWERGSNEHFNGMLRRFIKKGKPISSCSQEEIDKAVDWINNYPRKLLNFMSASHQYNLELHST
jgi:IS30 family transposase